MIIILEFGSVFLYFIAATLFLYIGAILLGDDHMFDKEREGDIRCGSKGVFRNGTAGM